MLLMTEGIIGSSPLALETIALSTIEIIGAIIKKYYRLPNSCSKILILFTAVV